MKTKFFIQAQWKSLWLKKQFMKSDQKCNCNVNNACLCLDRSAISSHSACDLRLITAENVDVKCAAFERSVPMRSGKNCLRLDLLDCEDILLCCSGVTDLVFFGLSGCTRLTIQDSRHFSLSLQRCWMVGDVPFLFRSPPMDEYPQQTASRNPFSKGPTKRSKGSDKKVRW